MKRLMIVVIAIIGAVVTSWGQGRFANWPEMQTFHSTLSQTFHPAEEGDLKPIRSRSLELLGNAKQLNAAPIPAEFDNAKMRSTLKRIEREADKVNALVVLQEQNSTIMKHLKVLHNSFHEVVGMCKKEGDEKKEQ